MRYGGRGFVPGIERVRDNGRDSIGLHGRLELTNIITYSRSQTSTNIFPEYRINFSHRLIIKIFSLLKYGYSYCQDKKKGTNILH